MYRLRFQSALHVFVAYLVPSLILTNQELSVHQFVLMPNPYVSQTEKSFSFGAAIVRFLSFFFSLVFSFPVIEEVFS